MEYSEYPPPPRLADIVQCFWTLTAPHGARHPDPALPDGHPELIVNLGDPFEAHTVDGRVRRQPRVMLVGQITAPFSVAPTGAIELVAARFTPSGASLLHRPMASITDSWIDVEDRFPNVAESGHGAEHARELLADALAHALQTGRPPGALVLKAVARINSETRAFTIAELAEALDTTPRQLQRRFHEEVGITPKRFARMRRFQRVLATWRNAPGEWAAVAVRCGYFDQAHLVRDFSELGGGTPAELLARMPEFTRLFTPLRGRPRASS